MRKLGASLDVEAMSLYNHVGNKDDVLDGVLESLLVEVPLPPAELPWTDRIRELARGFREITRRHPAMIPLFSTRKVKGRQAWQPLLCAYGILRDAGLPPDDAVDAFFATASYVLGYVLTEVGTLSGGDRVPTPEEAGVIDDGWFLELTQHLGSDFDWRFERGLDLLIAGLETRVAATPG